MGDDGGGRYGACLLLHLYWKIMYHFPQQKDGRVVTAVAIVVLSDFLEGLEIQHRRAADQELELFPPAAFGSRHVPYVAQAGVVITDGNSAGQPFRRSGDRPSPTRECKRARRELSW